MFAGNLSNLLIVESENGQVYFVENSSENTKLDEIRNIQKIEDEKRKKAAERKRKKENVGSLEKSAHAEDITVKQEIKQEPQEPETHNSYELDYTLAVPFVDPDQELLQVKKEISCDDSETEIDSDYNDDDYSGPSTSYKPSTSKTVKTEASVKIEVKSEFPHDTAWSDEDDVPLTTLKDDFEFQIPSPEQNKSKIPRRLRAKIFRENLSEAEHRAGGVAFGKHKMRKLVGVPACRYCDSIFVDRRERDAHDCKYLKCDPKNFICRFCGKELSRGTFSNHVHEAAACQYCGKKVLNPRQMKKHIASLHKGAEYKPPVQRDQTEIEKYIEEKRKAEAHIYKVREQRRLMEEENRLRDLHEYRKNPRYQCDICGRRETSKGDLTNHINMHLDIPLGICPQCGLKIFTKERLRKHSCMMAEKRVPFVAPNHKYCRFCGTTFESVEENRVHICPYHNPDDPKHAICRFCNKRVAKSDYGHHMERHKDSPNECYICKQKFMYRKGLRMHMKLHTGDKLYKCELCGTSFNYKQNYDHHIKTHGITGGKNLPCEYCGKSYSTEVTLKGHQARVHEVGMRCETCKAPLANRDVLLEHMMTIHGPVQCKHCGVTFIEPRKLKIHERKHAEPDVTNRIQCQFCVKTMTKSRLRRHVYKEHQEHFEDWSERNQDV